MNNKFLNRVVAMIMAFAMVMAMAGCTQDTQKSTEKPDRIDQPVNPTEMPKSLYTVEVLTKAGDGLSKCGVEVYTDASKTKLLYKGITNKEGKVVFEASLSGDYRVVLTKVSELYQLEPMYELTGATTTITLKAGMMDEYAMDNYKFSLGDPMLDFEVTLPDMSKVVLSDLLKEKKAVVLNFWYMNCAPCRSEFPYIQEGYEQVREDVAVLALNPLDSTVADVAKFQADNNYTFTMSKCDPRWQNMLKLMYYPTTLVIDRYGYICFIHTGVLETTEDFLDMVNYFISDDYEQNFFKSLGQIPKAE